MQQSWPQLPAQQAPMQQSWPQMPAQQAPMQQSWPQMQVPPAMDQSMPQNMPHAMIPSRLTLPITYEQMTPYMNQTSISQSGNAPTFTIPQTPMTTQQFEETIDSTDVQSYLGFMRTQIGRYMRLEQLMGSNNVEQRFGFLVGLGTNYVILQEITSGNIMVVDLFTIRLTYIYYSSPVYPPNVPQ